MVDSVSVWLVQGEAIGINEADAFYVDTKEIAKRHIQNYKKRRRKDVYELAEAQGRTITLEKGWPLVEGPTEVVFTTTEEITQELTKAISLGLHQFRRRPQE